MSGLSILCLITMTISAFGQVPSPVTEERKPESIPQLPLEVRLDLAKRQCFVPTYYGEVGPGDHAYARGHFRSGTSMDYAVVCHIPQRRAQNVLVYSNSGGAWHGEVISEGTFDPSPTADKCEATVGIATPKYIVDHARAYAPEELKRLPKLDHSGVDIGICEKASIIYYFHQGRWLTLQGAD
jgi:hypothetical protein